MKSDENGTNLETYPLDESMIVLMEEFTQQLRALQAARNGALMLFMKQHKITGTWQIAENGKEIVKVPDPINVP